MSTVQAKPIGIVKEGVHWCLLKLKTRKCERFARSFGLLIRFRLVSPIKEEVYLYDPRVLLQLNFHSSPAKFDPFISAVTPGETWLKVRPLKDGDYDRGFLQLLSQLTTVGDVTRTQFLTRFSQMKASGDYFVTVIEDTRKNEIIGAASLIIERKFIHGCAIRGRLEDVVVNDTYRGKQLGKLIVVTVSLLAKHLGCYKMSLDCKDKLIPFYKSLGYVLLPGNANSMTIRYDESPSTNGTHNPTSNTVSLGCVS